MRFITYLIVIIFGLLLIIPASFSFGPWAEMNLNPPLKAEIRLGSEVNGYQMFTIEGTKLRPCRLANYGASWSFDHSVVPTGLSDMVGNPANVPAVLQPQETFVLGPYYAVIPMSARLRPMVALVITLYYDCHFLWMTEEDLKIPVHLASPAELREAQ